MTRGIIASLAAAVVLTSSGSASALGLFGYQFSAAPVRSNSAEAAASSASLAPATDSLYPCLQYQNHVYEVCTAYITNASLAVLIPYYKYAHSPDAALRRYVTYRLGSRYTGAANSLMQRRVANWPPGTHEVSLPSISVLSANSSLQTNTATLVTREDWTVTDQNGRIIYQETGQLHTITLRRVPSYVLHKWVVSDIH